MKKKVLAITLATVLALSLGLVMAGPAGAAVYDTEDGDTCGPSIPAGRVYLIDNTEAKIDANPVIVADPTGLDLRLHYYESDTEIRVFNEQQNVSVTNLAYDGGTYTGNVDSHIIHQEPTLGTSGQVTPTPYTDAMRGRGCIEFATDIIGIIISDADLDASDSVVGLATVTYPAGRWLRGLEMGSGTGYQDLVEVDGNTIKVDLQSVEAMDQIRVITEPEPFVTNLCAGQDIEVGWVTVTNDEDTLYVTYSIDQDEYAQWVITETHLHVFTDGVDFSDIPMAKSKKHNNPIPGHFDYSMMHDPPVSEYTYEIPLGDLEDSIFIAAHAVVLDTDSCQGSVIGIERGTVGDVYEIDMGDGTPTLLGTITAGMSPSTSTADLNANNGYAFDYVNGRLYYALNTEGNLYFFDVVGGTTTPAGPLDGAPSNASYYQGAYYYINQDTDDLHMVTLNATTGAKVSETVTAGISGANNRSYNFGDIAITPEGFVYAAAKYSGEGHYYKYFTFDLSDPAGTYTEVAQYSVQRPQLALGGNGELYGVATGDGQFYSIDKTNGVLTPIFNPEIQFNDLASGWLCEPVTETAWGGACDSDNYWSDPDNLEGFVYFFNPGQGGNWASYFEYTIQ